MRVYISVLGSRILVTGQLLIIIMSLDLQLRVLDTQVKREESLMLYFLLLPAGEAGFKADGLGYWSGKSSTYFKAEMKEENVSTHIYVTSSSMSEPH